MNVVLAMFLLLACSYLMSMGLKRFGLPKILGPVIVGLVFGLSFFKGMFPQNVMTLIDSFRDLALIFIMFFVGLKIDLKEFKKSSRKSVTIASISVLVTLAFGFFSTLLLYNLGFLEGVVPNDVNIYFIAFFVGICISLTAEAVAIQVLEELNLLKTVIGETIIEAAIIDDLIGILLVAGLVAITPGANGDMSVTTSIMVKFLEIIAFCLVVYVTARYVMPIIMKVTEREKSRVDFFAVSIIVTLFLALFTEYLDLGGSILGALFSGIIIRSTLLKGDRYEQREEKDITSVIEITTFGLLAPFFFIWVGLNIDVETLIVYPLFTIILIIVALSGKLIGSIIGSKINKGTIYEGIIIGWGMNARFDVELLIATIVLGHSLINQSLFSTIVFVSLVTTLISTIVFKLLVKKHHGLQ